MTAAVTAAVCLLGAAAALQIGFFASGRRKPDPVSHFAMAAAAVMLLIEIALRSVRMGSVAVTNTHESLLFFGAAVSAAAFVIRLSAGDRMSAFAMFGAASLALGLLILSSSALAPREVLPPVPALQSFWLSLHVGLAFIGEAFFAVAFAASTASLFARDADRRAALEGTAAASVRIGYPVFTLGALLFGAVWAQTAWGTWWSWDPKETWALATWLIYTAYLHSRRSRALRGRAAAALCIAGFAFAMFTYFGVNFLLPGLHSYG